MSNREVPPVPTFRVDTKLFQELGELLVAKESTALVELIKNSYDADATSVTVIGTDLADPAHGSIVVTDDGVGMTEDEFRRGFLTIAGRTKNTGDRRSPVFGRRYTGEKGVGRLASHKLGTKLVVKSRKAGPAARGARELPPPVSELNSTIDWNAIEALETLDQVNGTRAVVVSERRLASRAAREEKSGTVLRISPLRSGWSARTRASFLNEAATLAPLGITWRPLPSGLCLEPLIFDQVPVRDQQRSDPGFQITFGGELLAGDQLIPDVATAANWVAELSYDGATGIIEIAVQPTARTVRRYPGSEGFRLRRDVGAGAGPTFRGRIFQRSDSVWDTSVQGIRVFMEGFRASPYGDPRDDWLGLERTYKSRAARQLTSLASIDSNDLPEGLEDEELVVQGNAAYLGAIFLHRSTSEGLQMLVNREGFLPGSEFDFLVDWTRVATDLIVRLGAVARREVKQVRREELSRQRTYAARADVNETPTALRVRERAISIESGFTAIQAAVERRDYAEAARQAASLQPSLSEVRELADQFGGEAVQWRVLASLGAELAAFVHEVNAVGLQIASLATELEEAVEIRNVTRMRAAIRRARQRALDLADRIRRNATYLVDATSFEGRRRRSRQPLRERVDAVLTFFESRIDRKGLSVENEVEADLRTPPLFPSELSGILTNLLSNSVKFADEDGRIRIDARRDDGRFQVRVQNTGDAVQLAGSERLFEAFRSTTERPDAVLGQGMGMGLTITRAFVQEYGGEIYFRRPEPGFATSIVFTIPER